MEASSETKSDVPTKDPVMEELKKELEDLARDVDENAHMANAVGQAKLSNLIGDAAIQAIEGGIDREKFLVACAQIYSDWEKHIQEIIRERKRSARIEKRAAEIVANATVPPTTSP